MNTNRVLRLVQVNSELLANQQGNEAGSSKKGVCIMDLGLS